MLEPLIDLLNTKTPLYPPFGRIVVAVVLLLWVFAASALLRRAQLPADDEGCAARAVVLAGDALAVGDVATHQHDYTPEQMMKRDYRYWAWSKISIPNLSTIRSSPWLSSTIARTIRAIMWRCACKKEI